MSRHAKTMARFRAWMWAGDEFRSLTSDERLRLLSGAYPWEIRL